MLMLVDTNVLLRRAQRHHPMNPAATGALDMLLERSETLYLTPQNLMEYWAVATRPAGENGLGLAPADAEQEIEELDLVFSLLPETPDVYPLWRKIARQVGVSGRQVHDAHLVATILFHGIDRILTFNDSDFHRYPGIKPIHPSQISASR